MNPFVFVAILFLIVQALFRFLLRGLLLIASAGQHLARLIQHAAMGRRRRPHTSGGVQAVAPASF